MSDNDYGRYMCPRCDIYRGYVCAEHREPSYEELKQRLAAAEARLNPPLISGAFAIDTDHVLFEGLELVCIEPKVLAATVHRERKRRLMLTAKNVVLEERLAAAEDESPVQRLTKAIQSDDDYAWSWQCNVAVPFMDEGGTHEQANKAAARFMLTAFGVDVTTLDQWKAFPWAARAAGGE